MSLSGKFWKNTFLPSVIRQGVGSCGNLSLAIGFFAASEVQIILLVLPPFPGQAGQGCFGQTFPEFPSGTKEFSHLFVSEVYETCLEFR